MNYFKLSGACLVLLCCTLSGFYFSLRLRTRLNFLYSVTEFLTRLQTNIRYFGDDVFMLIQISAPMALAPYFKESNLPFNIYWQKAAEELSKSFNLTREDYKSLVEFGRLLGTTDVEGQLSHIEIYKALFSAERDSFEKDCKIKSRLYKTLGFFAGAVLVLFII